MVRYHPAGGSTYRYRGADLGSAPDRSRQTGYPGGCFVSILGKPPSPHQRQLLTQRIRYRRFDPSQPSGRRVREHRPPHG